MNEPDCEPPICQVCDRKLQLSEITDGICFQCQATKEHRP